MDELMPFLAFTVPVTAVAWWLHRRSPDRGKHPLWPAFSATAVAAIHLVAGAAGYNLNALDANAAGTRWSDTMIWWEVVTGIALLPLTAYYWRKGIRSFEPKSAGKLHLAR
jgi:hypothetical protein